MFVVSATRKIRRGARFTQPRVLALALALGAALVLAAAPAWARTLAATGATPSGAELVRAAVHIPLRNSAELDGLIQAQNAAGSPQQRHFLSPSQFRSAFGASDASVREAVATLTAAGLHVEIQAQGLSLTGPRAAIETTFGIALRAQHRVASALTGRSTAGFLTAAGPPRLPPALARLNAVLVSFSGVSNPEMQLTYRAHARHLSSGTADSPLGPYLPADLRGAYAFPPASVANGSGRSIAIVAESDVSNADLQAYFARAGEPVPTIVRREVDGGTGFDPVNNLAGAFEASLDVEQAGGIAPGATIALYIIPPPASTADIYTGLNDDFSAIVADDRVDVVSSSLGICELAFAPAYNGGVDERAQFGVFHDLFRQALAQGITLVSASGDLGSRNCAPLTGTSPVLGIDWPASDPAVVAVGGTNLVTAASPDTGSATYVRENANADALDPRYVGLTNAVFGSGGGISVQFARPPYQALAQTKTAMRTTPDLAFHMGGCPTFPAVAVQPCGADRSSVIEIVAGTTFDVQGTSAAAPGYAALLALKAQLLHTRLGDEHYQAYALALANSSVPGGFYHTNIPGANLDYQGGGTYNYLTGLGTPVAANYALAFGSQRAGEPGRSR